MRAEARIERQMNIERIHSYHRGNHAENMVFTSDRPQKADSSYHLEDGSLPSMYGLEIETEVWGITDSTVYANVLKQICFQNFHADLFKIETDATLDGGHCGAECITQPMTKAYIRNHYRDFKAMFTWFSAMGVSCDRTGNCGMHIHISLSCFGRTKKAQDEAIRKLYFVVNYHYNLMCSLLYRNIRHTAWCSRMDYSVAKTMNLESMSSSHGNCFNGSHYDHGNIELRLVGGQKDYACFRNTMESVFHLIEAVKRLSWKDLEDVVKLFSGCNRHVFDRLRSYVHQNGHISEEQIDAIRRTVSNERFL